MKFIKFLFAHVNFKWSLRIIHVFMKYKNSQSTLGQDNFWDLLLLKDEIKIKRCPEPKKFSLQFSYWSVPTYSWECFIQMRTSNLLLSSLYQSSFSGEKEELK